MKSKGKTLVVIVGPTAVGKTALAIRLAQALDTEIVSADSRQFYRELTIGTAKPSAAELNLVPHHFIDTHSIEEDYDAARFGEDALVVIERLFLKKDYVVMCGGSGLYVKAVCEGFDDIPEVHEAIRESIVTLYQQHGLAWLQQKMAELDPHHFATLDRQNPHRLIRALEVKMATGNSIASYRQQKQRQHNFDIVKIGLELSRDELYARIDRRMDDMLAAGLIEEAKSLYPFRRKNALQTVGYQEVFDFLDNAFDYDEMVRLLKRNSRRYAKRQLTWFKRDEAVQWFHPADETGILKFISG